VPQHDAAAKLSAAVAKAVSGDGLMIDERGRAEVS
jgi:hypothetical protein